MAQAQAQVDVVGVDGLDAGHDGDVVEAVGRPQAAAAGAREEVELGIQVVFRSGERQGIILWAATGGGYRNAPERKLAGRTEGVEPAGHAGRRGSGVAVIDRHLASRPATTCSAYATKRQPGQDR